MFPINEMHLIYHWDQKVGIKQEPDCCFPCLELPSSHTWVVWEWCCPNVSPSANNPATANQRHGCFAESHDQIDKHTTWVSPAFVTRICPPLSLSEKPAPHTVPPTTTTSPSAQTAAPGRADFQKRKSTLGGEKSFGGAQHTGYTWKSKICLCKERQEYHGN